MLRGGNQVWGPRSPGRRPPFGNLDEFTTFGRGQCAAKIDNRGMRIAPDDLGLRRIVKKESPLAVDARGEFREVGAERYLPAVFGRQQTEGFENQSQGVGPRLKDYRDGPHSFDQGRFGQHARPTCIAGKLGPRLTDSGRIVTGTRHSPGGQDAGVFVPGGFAEGVVGHDPGRAARNSGNLLRLEGHVMGQLVGSLGVIKTRVTDSRQDVKGTSPQAEQQMGVGDWVQLGARVMHGIGMAISAERLQPRGQILRHPLRANYRAKASTSRLETLTCRRVEDLLTHEPVSFQRRGGAGSPSSSTMSRSCRAGGIPGSPSSA